MCVQVFSSSQKQLRRRFHQLLDVLGQSSERTNVLQIVKIVFLLFLSNKRIRRLRLSIWVSIRSCRKTQAELDKCMQEKMNLQRPEIGWMSKVRLFESDRPKPVQKSAYRKEDGIGVPPDSIEQVPEAVDSLKRTKGRVF